MIELAVLRLTPQQALTTKRLQDVIAGEYPIMGFLAEDTKLADPLLPLGPHLGPSLSPPCPPTKPARRPPGERIFHHRCPSELTIHPPPPTQAFDPLLGPASPQRAHSAPVSLTDANNAVNLARQLGHLLALRP
ncbi:hypothetical protein N7478_008390 [Penicillium angulare]|uniref:uncharacterized protein n=1 Tax=Penicillium angulare TaxID=116970 RepID=UPI002541F44F|nr:uncharacterized protein N7478_008390 [Penicillium angulare]KAJ5273265.1 hypothetical protein N7478_008390 [Penicillium angulare]